MLICLFFLGDARAICCGKRGEIYKRYREGQEDQFGALDLVTNAVVLWNAIYIEAALNQLRQEGVEVKDEDVARLSPLNTTPTNCIRAGTICRSNVLVAAGQNQTLAQVQRIYPLSADCDFSILKCCVVHERLVW